MAKTELVSIVDAIAMHQKDFDNACERFKALQGSMLSVGDSIISMLADNLYGKVQEDYPDDDQDDQDDTTTETERE